jgi:hypothetical protein
MTGRIDDIEPILGPVDDIKIGVDRRAADHAKIHLLREHQSHHATGDCVLYSHCDSRKAGPETHDDVGQYTGRKRRPRVSDMQMVC